MRKIRTSAGQVSLRVVLTAMISLMAFTPTAAELTHAQREEVWKHFSNLDKAVGVSSQAFQSLAGNDDTKALFESYGNTVLIINVSKELFHSGDLQKAFTLLKDKLQDKMIEKLAPNLHSWLGWMTWAKTGMELFKDVVFDPMVEQSQLDTYIGMREAGNSPEDSYAAVRGLGYSVERAKKEFKKQHGDQVFVKGTNEILPRWQDKFMHFLKAGFETKYQEKILRDIRLAAMKEAQDAESRLADLEAQILALLEQYKVESVVLEPAKATVKPGESVSFTAIAVYKDKSTPRSASDVTAEASWSGADGNVFTAPDTPGKTATVRAEYLGLLGHATVTIADTSEESIDDLLEEFGADEDGDSSGTRTVGEEILLEIQRVFDDAVDEYERCHADFQARLNSLAGEPEEAICSDNALASAFACMDEQFAIVVDAHAEAHTRLSTAAPGINWADVGMEADIIPEEQSGINPMDQITITLINTKYSEISQSYQDIDNLLAARAPGCDSEDLRGAVTRIPGGLTGGGETGGGSGGTGGGGMGVGPLRFQKQQAPVRQSKDPARCAGGGYYLQVEGGSDPVLPDEIRPDGDYTISVRVEWRASGRWEDVGMKVAAFIFNLRRESEDIETPSGNRVFTFRFSGSEIDFSQPGGAIHIQVGGGILCDGGSSDDTGMSFTQGYIRFGSE